MKSTVYKNLRRMVVLCSLMGILLFSCKKDTYLTDGGLASATAALSTYDYLAGNQYHIFDTLILIIDHLGLKDSVNQAGTFFAPSDYAIHRVMSDNNLSSLDDLYKRINTKFLTQYMFTDTALTLDNATTAVVTYKNWAGSTVGLTKLAASYTVANSSLTYYTLEYVKINGALDGSSEAAAGDETDAILKCQTTGIKTASGTNLNVLANTATLNLFSDDVPTTTTYSFNLNVVQNKDYSSSALQLDSSSLASIFGIPASTIAAMLAAGNDSLVYYNTQSDGTLSNDYTANPPGFWMNADGDVVSWGTDAYLFAEYQVDDFVINVGAYPDNPVAGDTYTIKPAMVFIDSLGVKHTAVFTIHVTIVAP